MQNMVTIIEDGMEQFKQRIREMDVFCFGSGKYFTNFIAQNPEIHVTGVIDNYREGTVITTGAGEEYALYSVKEFCSIYHDKCILVLTLRLFEEVVDQLDGMKELDGILCFIPMIYIHSSRTEEEQKTIWQSKMQALLAERVYKNKQRAARREGNYYQIWEYYERSNIGGSKARTDISRVLADCGYVFRKIHCTGLAQDNLLWQQAQEEWENLAASLEDGAVLFMQHPAPSETILPRQMLDQIKKQKHIRSQGL